MNYDNETRLELLRYLEQKRRSARADMFGMAPQGVTITLADLLHSNFINIGQGRCALLEQFENEDLIEIKQHPMRSLNWSPTMLDRVDLENAYFVKILPKFQETFKRELLGKAPAPLACDMLVLDLKANTLQYGARQPIEISPNRREIKFLKLLMSRDGATVKYSEFARELGLLTDQNDHRDFSRDIQHVKRDLISKVLRVAGVSKSKVTEMIIPKTGIGYALRCSLG